jgi:hypothetical protein
MGSHLLSVDAWITNGGGGDRTRAAFDEYRRSFCAVVSGLACIATSFQVQPHGLFSSIVF